MARKEELEAKIAKLESDKAGIEKWVKEQEKKVDKLNEESAEIRKNINAEKSDLTDRQKAVAKIIEEQSKLDASVSSKLSKLEVAKESLRKEKLEFGEFCKKLNSDFSERANKAAHKENTVNDKDKYVRKIFKDLKEFEDAHGIE